MSVKNKFNLLVEECKDNKKEKIREGLPINLYHATTDKLHACLDGLKPRCELEGKCGLGGGENFLISFTTDENIVKSIAHDLKHMISIANGSLNWNNYCTVLDKDDFFDENIKPCNLFHETMGTWHGENWKKYEEGFKRGEKTDIEYREEGKPLIRRKKVKEDYIRNQLFKIWKEYLKRREKRGGLRDPYFFGGNLPEVKHLTENDVGVFEVEGKIPNTIICKRQTKFDKSYSFTSTEQLLEWLQNPPDECDIYNTFKKLYTTPLARQEGWNYLDFEKEFRLSKNMFHKLKERPDLEDI